MAWLPFIALTHAFARLASIALWNNIPHDTEVLAKYYEHQNKDGSPDRRFNENALISVCGYGLIGLESSNGLKLCFMASNREKAREFERQLAEYSNQLKSL